MSGPDHLKAFCGIDFSCFNSLVNKFNYIACILYLLVNNLHLHIMNSFFGSSLFSK